MGIFWVINLILVLLESVFLILTLRNYVQLKEAPVGRIMVVISGIFLAQSLILALSYVKWSYMGIGKVVAIPLLLVSSLGLIGSFLLYMLSRI